MKLTSEQLASILQRPAIAKRNPVGGETEAAQPERSVCNEPLGQAQGTKSLASRFRVSVEGRRVRLLDPDNACPKQAVDCCRYAGLIPDDRPQDIELVVTQTKVRTKAEEMTVITITEL